MGQNPLPESCRATPLNGDLMTVGKVISLFLIDGEPDGRLVGEIFNWTGKAMKIPRRLVKESTDREELSKAGVYFLFGRDEENPDQNAVYIGEAEEPYKRLLQHLAKMDFWNEAVVFLSKDENLNKAHIKYLESKLYADAQTARRYKLINANTPTCPAISESEQAVMTDYLANLKILINTMGYKVLDPLASKSEKKRQAYQIKAARGANAMAVITNEGVVVLRGSEIAESEVPSTPTSTINMRSRLIQEGVVVESDGKLTFSEDYLFSSPSTAAAVVMGRGANGLIEWKDKKGRTLKDAES